MEQKIPNRLKEARKKLNLNQIQIAMDLDIQQKSISDIENGKIQNIPNTYIYYFYKKGVSLNWIYDGVEPMMNEDTGKISTKVEFPVDNLLQGTIDFPEKAEITMTDNNDKEKIESGNSKNGSTDLFERLIDSKDYNIRSLLAYIKSLENNLEYFKDLLEKTLVNKLLTHK